MFSLRRITVYSPSLRHLVKSLRAVSSNTSSLVTSSPVHNNATTEDERKPGNYGEKEIFLLPCDSRTPLPGNTGLAPLSMLFKDVKYPLPAKADERCDVIAAEMAEERHRNTLSLCTLALKELNESLFQKEISHEEVQQLFECVAHECPQLLRKDFSDLFPKIDQFLENLTVITLCQKTENDMSIWSEMLDVERGNLEEFFTAAAVGICSILKENGYWADFIHPSHGKLFLNPLTNATMLETDLRYRHFGFTVEDLGCCKVISHHRWGTHSFVGAIFTNAPLESPEVRSILKLCPRYS